MIRLRGSREELHPPADDRLFELLARCPSPRIPEKSGKRAKSGNSSLLSATSIAQIRTGVVAVELRTEEIYLPDLTLLEDAEDLSDEELARLAGSRAHWAEEALIEKFTPKVRAKARSFFLVGGDREDLLQEGMIGLLRAIRDYRAERNCSFKAFAELCITRQMIAAIRAATRYKHQPLNTYVSFERQGEDPYETDRLLLAVSGEPESDPLYILVSVQEFASLISVLEEALSNLEADVLDQYLEGKQYREISEHLGIHVKSIDNALQRIKRKIQIAIEARDLIPA